MRIEWDFDKAAVSLLFSCFIAALLVALALALKGAPRADYAAPTLAFLAAVALTFSGMTEE